VRDAVLTVRERPEGERRVIPRADWAFVPAPDGGVPRQLALEGKFEPGQLYELSYRARDPYVVAAGLAGIRDLLAFLRGHSFEGAPANRPARARFRSAAGGLSAIAMGSRAAELEVRIHLPPAESQTNFRFAPLSPTDGRRRSVRFLVGRIAYSVSSARLQRW
jgi:hypothetical protein